MSEFEHEHVAFSQSIDRISALAVGPREPKDDLLLVRLVESLRDDLFTHFAKEEEGLFPFLTKVLPDLQAEIDRLLVGHDVVCGSLVRLAHALGSSTQVSLAPSLLERFERAYQDHARLEIMLLRSVGSRLGADDRRELADLVREL